MSIQYRLAVIERDGADILVVERGGRLLPIDAVLNTNEVQALGGAPSDLMPLLADWPRWVALLPKSIAAADARFQSDGIDAATARFRPPIKAPGKIVCIGANYWDHIREMKIPVEPTYPFSFLKPANNTLRGSGEPVVAPPNVAMFDWEAELAVVIGHRARDVPAADALDIIAGYANYNDLSARDWLASRPGIGVDWVRHKAFDGFGPMGPYVLPASFVPDPQDLSVKLWVNGEIKQDSSTSQMVFGVAAIIEHLTSIMTLEPGDIIATGTPAGVGHGREPPQFLKAGDEVRIVVGDLGELVTPIVAPA